MVFEEKKFVLSHTLTNVSLEYINYCSPEEKHFNVPWNIGIYHFENILSVYCYCNKLQEKENMWTIDTVLEFTLKTSSGKAYRKDEKIRHQFSNKDCFGSGQGNFISWNESMKDYAVDDCVTVEIHVEILNMTGFSKQDLKSFDKMIIENVTPRSFDESNKKFSDVTLVVDGKKFFVLKKFLAMHSSYFETLFLGKFEEADKEEVTLKDIDSTDFQKLLEFLHGEPDINDKTVDGILHLAQMYDMSLPTRKCEEFLIEATKKSIKDQLKIATQYQLESLKEFCLSKINTVAEIKAVLDGNLAEMDPSVTAALLGKLLALH